MPEPLKDLEEEWENGLEVVAETRVGDDEIHRVLRDEENGIEPYHLHKYFKLSTENWGISVEKRGTAEEVMKALTKKIGIPESRAI